MNSGINSDNPGLTKLITGRDDLDLVVVTAKDDPLELKSLRAY